MLNYILFFSYVVFMTSTYASTDCVYHQNSTSPCKNFTTPTTLNYACCDTESGTRYNWTDNVNVTTNATAKIGFPFQFFGTYPGLGTTVNQITICPNGLLLFKGDNCSYDKIRQIPKSTGKNAFLAVFFSDVNASGTINVSTFGNTPNRVFVVQYDVCGDTSCSWRLQAQVKLFETTNRIELHYKLADSIVKAVTIGIESLGGSQGLPYYLGNITNGLNKTMVSFVPPTPYTKDDNDEVSDSSSEESNGSSGAIIFFIVIIAVILIMSSLALSPGGGYDDY